MNTPELGYYYHYKHDPKGEVGNYAYYVIGVGLHSEGGHGELNTKDMLVVYQPIYEAFVYKNGKLFDIRPLEMFMEKVVKDGKEMERFTKITDPKIIAELEKIKAKMYN
jgi:hypothetical protein